MIKIMLLNVCIGFGLTTNIKLTTKDANRLQKAVNLCKYKRRTCAAKAYVIKQEGSTKFTAVCK